MQYITRSVGSEYEPKLLGTYEMELSAIIEELGRQPFDTIIDVGAAEGYYAVGLALKVPRARVIAFEEKAAGRQLISELAAKNGAAGRIEILGACTETSLAEMMRAGDNTLIVMDVEGAEAKLLDPVSAPPLRHATILLELHQFAVPNLSDLIEGRFGKSHRIQEIRCVPRTLADFPLAIPHLMRLFWSDALLDAISEKRHPDSTWWLMTPLIPAS